MLADFWAHTYYDDPKAAETVEDDDFNADEVADLIGYSPGEQGSGVDGVNDWEELE